MCSVLGSTGHVFASRLDNLLACNAASWLKGWRGKADGQISYRSPSQALAKSIRLPEPNVVGRVCKGSNHLLDPDHCRFSEGRHTTRV
jgi:hypothetical protein